MNEDEIVKNKRNETIEEIDKIVDLLSSYYCDKFSIEIILPIATQIYMDEQKQNRHYEVYTQKEFMHNQQYM